MSAAAERAAAEEERFMTLVESVCAADRSLSPMGAGLLAALHLEVCSDTRSFSRILGVAHALVLREVTDLSDRELLAIVSRNDRTQRTELALTSAGATLVSKATA